MHSILALCIRHEIEVYEIVTCTIFYLLYALSTEYLHDSVKLLCPSLKLSAGRLDPFASNRNVRLVLSRHPSNASNLRRNLKMHPYQKKITLALFTRTHPSQDSMFGLTLAGVSSSSICQRIIGELYSFTNNPPMVYPNWLRLTGGIGLLDPLVQVMELDISCQGTTNAWKKMAFPRLERCNFKKKCGVFGVAVPNF